jgi:tyrosine-protein kinase Etk/Wzc
MHEVVGLSSAPGLLDVLDGDCSLESARRHTRRPNVSVLPLGGSPDAWRAGLQIDMLRVVLGQLGSHAIVVVDAPPVLESAASLLFAETAGVVLLVGDLRSGRRKDVDAAMGLMEAARPVIAGWVVNLPHRRTAPRSSGPSFELDTNTGSWQQAIDRSDPVAS